MGWTTVVSRPLLVPLILGIVLFYGTIVTISIPRTEERHSDETEIQRTVMIPLGKEQYLRVMTFNIRHGKGLDGRVNLKRIIDDIRYGDPDIVALQEVDRFHIRSRFTDQVNALKKALNMDAFFSRPSITSDSPNTAMPS